MLLSPLTRNDLNIIINCTVQRIASYVPSRRMIRKKKGGGRLGFFTIWYASHLSWNIDGSEDSKLYYLTAYWNRFRCLLSSDEKTKSQKIRDFAYCVRCSA